MVGAASRPTELHPPGDVRRGPRHRAGRHRRLYACLSQYGKVSREDAGPKQALSSRVATPSRIPPPISRLPAVPEPMVAGERFRKENRPGDCPACPPHARLAAECEVLLFRRRRYQAVEVSWVGRDSDVAADVEEGIAGPAALDGVDGLKKPRGPKKTVVFATKTYAPPPLPVKTSRKTVVNVSSVSPRNTWLLAYCWSINVEPPAVTQPEPATPGFSPKTSPR